MYLQRHNARYRGPVYSEDINSLQLETIADITTLHEAVDNLKSPSDIQNGSNTVTNIYRSEMNSNVLVYTGKMASIDDFTHDLAKLSYITVFNCIGGLY